MILGGQPEFNYIINFEIPALKIGQPFKAVKHMYDMRLEAKRRG